MFGRVFERVLAEFSKEFWQSFRKSFSEALASFPTGESTFLRVLNKAKGDPPTLSERPLEHFTNKPNLVFEGKIGRDFRVVQF